MLMELTNMLGCTKFIEIIKFIEMLVVSKVGQNVAHRLASLFLRVKGPGALHDFERMIYCN